MTEEGRTLLLPFLASAAVLVLLVGGVVVLRARLLSGSERGAGGASPGAGRQDPSPAAPPPADPSPSPSPSVPKEPLLIHGAGDSSLDPSYISSYASQGYGYAWSGLDGLFRRDDLTVINVECAVSDLGSPVPKEFNFRGDPDALPAMREAGVEVGNLGNNHSYDFGPDAVVDTRKNLKRNGIAPVGAGKDDVQALAPAWFTIKGWRIAVLGFDQVVDPYPEAVAAPGHPGTAAGHDVDAMVKAIRRAAREADIVVVDIHWGVELDTQPRAEQVDEGHRFVDAGADIIFGGHSHRLQPMETYQGRPIFYSLGNFVWPNFSSAGSTTAVAEVRVTRKGIFKGRLIPAYIEASGHPVLQGS